MNKRDFIKRLMAGSMLMAVHPFLPSCQSEKKKPLQAFNIDFNWGGGRNQCVSGSGYMG